MSRRGLAIGIAALCALIAAFAFLQPDLDCPDPAYHSVSPDGGHSITVCSRSRAIAMPGSSGDAPGWIALRNARGQVSGVVSLDMIQTISAAEWSQTSVTMPLTAAFEFDNAPPDWTGWIADRAWKWRAFLGLVPTDDEFR